MKTLLKIAGFALLGIGAIVVVLMLLGMITWALHVIIPLAVLAVIGFVVWKMMAGGAKTAELPSAKDEEPLAERKTEPSKTLSAEEAARQFEALKGK
jgi:hypothetical protein